MGTEKTLTILFADVVGSTRLYDALGDEKARETVQYCLQVMTRATEQHGGQVIKTMGDEVLATFESADDAMEAASQIQESITDELVVDETSIKIRIGCHYGKATLESGDVFGNAVNIASRVTSQAKSGQVLTTSATVEALSPNWRASARQIDVAPLRGSGEEVALFEILWKREDITSMLPSVIIEDTSEPRTLTLRYKNQVIHVSEDRPTVAMGRADDSDLVVNNHLISRLHARIELQRGKFRLIDESTNGTFVLDSKGVETFVRRDSARIEGEGYIGLGKVAEADSGHAIHYVCTD